MSTKHMPYFNLVEALGKPGCALCTLGKSAVDRFLEGMIYEYVNDTGMQQMLIAAHGFCATHSHLLLGQHGALGVAILYKAILRHLQAELPGEQVSDKNWASRLARQMGRNDGPAPLSAHAPCPACQLRDETAGRAFGVLGEHQKDTDLIAAFQGSDGFCLPHFRQALEHLDGPARGLLLARQRLTWQELETQLGEFIRKNDFRFQHEGFTPEEEDVWRRVVWAVCGAPGVF